MPREHLFRFDYSYLSLPPAFYSLVKPSAFSQPEVFLLNEKLCHELNIAIGNHQALLALLYEEESLPYYAQAYAGHQFGFFTQLGDGRAIVLGEHLTDTQQRFDVQLKGSGITQYSRRGDGKATLQSMLREYLISEAMYHLKIPTSRSLAVIKTGETVYRETEQAGAALIRIMKSHIRVGTFQYAARLADPNALRTFTFYTLKRLYPDCETTENPVLSCLQQVIKHQIALVVDWMRVGFIHGVMNTDNTAISGETFDYGPCAFMNAYHPDTVYSSIDYQGRYAFGNQPIIIKWNLARFAETLLPLLHENPDEALAIAQTAINQFDALWQTSYYDMMLKKIGIPHPEPALYGLVDELLERMKNLQLDYTNTFFGLAQPTTSAYSLHQVEGLATWLEKWNSYLASTGGQAQAQPLMQQYNPMIIPRNHIVEKILEAATHGNLTEMEKFLAAMAQTYQYESAVPTEYLKPTEKVFEKYYRTFCGT